MIGNDAKLSSHVKSFKEEVKDLDWRELDDLQWLCNEKGDDQTVEILKHEKIYRPQRTTLGDRYGQELERLKSHLNRRQ